ncbi:MAG: hypothetical protein KGL53_04070 [Elusimicrobia bacterium]|nr:hypothetical protein [Elusimicrobiota bacterium]
MKMLAPALLALALPAHAQVGGLPAPVAAGAEGALALPMLSIPAAATPIMLLRPAAPAAGPDATISLNDIFNRNWKAESYQTPAGPVWLGTHFDFNGDAYLSVLLPHAMVPVLYKYERGMGGTWEAGGETYQLSLDVSIFRSKTSNYVVVKRRSDGAKVYVRRIRDLLLSTYPLGRQMTIGGREYRLFFSHGVLHGNPAHIDTQSYALVFVTNADPNGMDFRSYIIPFRDLDSGALVTYQLLDGAKVRLRAVKSSGELQVYLP